MFGERLKELRKSKDMTQKELGDYLNLSDRVIGYYEANRHFPDGDVLVKIADLFDVSLDYLLGRTDEKTNIIIKNKDFEYEIDTSKRDDTKTQQIKDKLKEMLELLSEDEE